MFGLCVRVDYQGSPGAMDHTQVWAEMGNTANKPRQKSNVWVCLTHTAGFTPFPRGLVKNNVSLPAVPPPAPPPTAAPPPAPPTAALPPPAPTPLPPPHLLSCTSLALRAATPPVHSTALLFSEGSYIGPCAGPSCVCS